MRRIFTTLILVFSLSVCNAQWVTIPDPDFRNWLQSNYPACMSGTQMDTTCSAIVNDTSLYLVGLNIYDITGVEYFDSLRWLHCGSNHLSRLPYLPLSLKTLFCYDNLLDSMLLLPNSLVQLDCSQNQISFFQPLPNTLKFLSCGSNLITALPILPVGLEDLDCSFNLITSLPPLPLNIEELICNNNQIDTIPDLPIGLKGLNCRQTLIHNLPTLPNSLVDLNCIGDSLINLPTLINCSNLQYLKCSNCHLTNIPSLPNSIKYLNCQLNQLITLPNLPLNLYDLDCSYNQLISIPSLPFGLNSLYCYDNLLTSLPSFPSTLNHLNCSYNDSLKCMPFLPNIMNDIYFENTSVQCLLNIPFILGSSYPDVTNFPVCNSSFNPNGCTLCSPTPQIINQSICSGESYNFNGTNLNITGNYSVTLNAINGCDSIVNLNLTVINSSTNSITENICIGDIYNFNGLNLNTTGIYFDTLNAINGCDSVVNLNLTVETINTAIQQSNDTLTVSGNNVQWFDCNTQQTIPGVTGNSFVPITSGIYAAIITEGNCSDTTSCIQIFTSVNDLSIDYPQFTIYPNPTDENITVLYSQPCNNCRIEISNTLGQIVYEEQTNSQLSIINCQSFLAGIYFVALRSDKMNAIKKLVKQ